MRGLWTTRRVKTRTEYMWSEEYNVRKALDNNDDEQGQEKGVVLMIIFSSCCDAVPEEDDAAIYTAHINKPRKI